MSQAAVRADAIAHHEHDAVADGKPQPRALLAGVRGIYLLELGEDALDVLLGDAHASSATAKYTFTVPEPPPEICALDSAAS